MTDCTAHVWDTARTLAEADALGALLARFWPADDWTGMAEKFAGRRALAAHVALDAEGRLVGCKIGFERNRGVYESWLGGVAPEWQGRGVATALMTAQHEWARAAGFKAVETRTRQPNRAMAILNLKAGFVVAGVVCEPGEPVRILFRKPL